MNKKVTIGQEAKKELKAGVDILADAVKATLGPRGRNVSIQLEYGPPLITKDGVTVARSINLEQPIQNMGAQLIKSVAAAANQYAGDGTTTATVLAQSIFKKGFTALAAGQNPVLLKRGIDLATDKLVEQLTLNSFKISDEKSIKNVATISANNDSELGALITEAVTAVGEYGFINVENNSGFKTEIVYTEGLKIDRGLISAEFISNPGKMTCELGNAYVLCYDDEIKSIHDVAEILTEVANTGRSILIIAKGYSQETIGSILYNRTKQNLNFCLIKAPGFGDTRREMLRDISIVTGGGLFHNDHGMQLKGVTLSNLGIVKKAVVGINQTILIDGAGNSDEIKNRVSVLEEQLKNKDLYDTQIQNIQERIAKLTGGAATFLVGGASESEVEEKKARVEDAINAVRAALLEGVVPGGGAALIHASSCLNDLLKRTDLLEEELAGIKIIKEAVTEPLHVILDNSGDGGNYYKVLSYLETSGKKSGYDALKRECVPDMIKHGVIDPLKVVKTALIQAASAVGTLLTTEVTITNVPDEYMKV